MRTPLLAFAAAASLVAVATPVSAGNALRGKGQPIAIADTPLRVTPPRDWNRLGYRVGKKAETWTLDGEALNDVTFFAGIAPGEPLMREASKKRKPLPKFTAQTLLVEVPELVEGTYRARDGIATFAVTGAREDRFLDRPGIRFTFDYVDDDGLSRKGQGRAAIVDGQLYLATFSAPRLHYYDRTLPDFDALADSAKLG